MQTYYLIRSYSIILFHHHQSLTCYSAADCVSSASILCLNQKEEDGCSLIFSSQFSLTVCKISRSQDDRSDFHLYILLILTH